MAGIIHKLVRRTKRRIKAGRSDGRTHALFEAGVVLLARQDYELVSVARIAREAGCSVGAFYSRFPDKNAYLYQLIADAFRTLTDDANLVLDNGRWPRDSASAVARHVVNYVVTKLASRRAAGVIRATLKLATMKPATLELFQDYRSAVTKRAITLLAPRFGINDQTRSVQVSMQIVFATITDAILQNGQTPLKAGTARMVEALTNTLVGHAGPADKKQWARLELDEEAELDESHEKETEEPPELPGGRIAVYDPGDRVYRGSVAGSQKMHGPRHRAHKAASPHRGSAQSRKASESKSDRMEKAPLVAPGRAPPESKPPDAPKRKRRLI